MIVLIIGTPNSGKSDRAEDIACKLSGNASRYYLATMIAYDEEGVSRIVKHRNKRAGKGFITIEKPFDIENIELPEKAKCILLECISNLVGNEMYENSVNKNVDTEAIAKYVFNEVSLLSKKTDNLVIVTNEFELKDEFDNDTRRYIDAINLTNDKLKNIADEIITI